MTDKQTNVNTFLWKVFWFVFTLLIIITIWLIGVGYGLDIGKTSNRKIEVVCKNGETLQ